MSPSLLSRRLPLAAPEVQHEVVRDRLSISDAIQGIADRLRQTGPASFFALFEGQRTRRNIVVTFLALLELAKEHLIEIMQGEPLAPIYLKSLATAK